MIMRDIVIIRLEILSYFHTGWQQAALKMESKKIKTLNKIKNIL